MKTLALVMIVKNESRCLEKCLAKARKLVDKIYITDTGSTDNTVEIARKYGANISYYEWNQDFAAARNYALAQSDCDWNLILDADEYLISGKRRDIQEFMEEGTHVGEIELHNFYKEKNDEISSARMYITRLIPKGTGYVGKIHEQIDTSLPSAPVSLVFEHDGYMQDGKGERNLEILLEEWKANPEDSYVLYQIAKTMHNLERSEEADTYFQAFYKLVPQNARYRAEGVVLYLYHLIQLQRFERGLDLIAHESARLLHNADFHFACGMFYTQMILSDTQKYIGYLSNIEKSYMRCLEIGEVPENEGVVGTGSFKAAHNLGVWFEVTGDQVRALEYYRMAHNAGYAPSSERIKVLVKH